MSEEYGKYVDGKFVDEIVYFSSHNDYLDMTIEIPVNETIIKVTENGEIVHRNHVIDWYDDKAMSDAFRDFLKIMCGNKLRDKG